MTETLSGRRTSTDPAAVFTIGAGRASSPLTVGNASRYIQGAAALIALMSIAEAPVESENEPSRVFIEAAADARFLYRIKRLSFSSPLEIAIYVSGGLAVLGRVTMLAERAAQVRIAHAKAHREEIKSRISADVANDVVRLLRTRFELEASEAQRQIRDNEAARQAVDAASDVLIAADRVAIEET